MANSWQIYWAPLLFCGGLCHLGPAFL